MRHLLDKMTDLAAIPGNEESLKAGLATFTEDAGYSAYAYVYFRTGYTMVISNYSGGWQSTYFQKNHAAVDPVIRRARLLKGAFTWSGEQERHRLTKAERSFYSDAAAFGIRSGITIPIKAAQNTIAMFTLASDKPAIDLTRELDPVEAAAAVGQLHARIVFTDPTPTVNDGLSLDPKAATYLSWFAVGKSMGEIADIEGVKYNTVRVKLQEARKPFDIHSNTHMSSVAIRRKLI
ncbi:autoinducer-binding transcriptional regulator TraR [Rhizobium binae]|uniref:autoinducer-binding transcriptional regulator TraR n=1 Tax=Rhizobium binae TaxID=1138190 RepID=UPI001C832E94|nr:transcriptional regulator TraR [Rhizobium binae]MBX4962641.1 transcriptional regulator TraR [Rhizobium binae]